MEILMIFGIFAVIGIITYILETVKPGSTDEFYKRWNERSEFDKKVRDIERIKRQEKEDWKRRNK